LCGIEVIMVKTYDDENGRVVRRDSVQANNDKGHTRRMKSMRMQDERWYDMRESGNGLELRTAYGKRMAGQKCMSEVKLVVSKSSM